MRKKLLFFILLIVFSSQCFALFNNDDTYIIKKIINVNSSSLDSLCNVDNSFLYRFGGLWGCGQLNASQMNVTITYNITNITTYQLNESDPLSFHISDGVNASYINNPLWLYAITSNSSYVLTNGSNVDFNESMLNSTILSMTTQVKTIYYGGNCSFSSGNQLRTLNLGYVAKEVIVDTFEFTEGIDYVQSSGVVTFLGNIWDEDVIEVVR